MVAAFPESSKKVQTKCSHTYFFLALSLSLLRSVRARTLKPQLKSQLAFLASKAPLIKELLGKLYDCKFC